MDMLENDEQNENRNQFSKCRFSIKKFMNKIFLLVTLIIVLGIFFVAYKTVEIVTLQNSRKNVAKNVNELVAGHEGVVSVDLESNLQDIIEKTDLYVREYPYNDYFPVRDENGNIKYYVLYNGIIKYGINVEDIKISKDDNDKIIIRVPKAEIKNYDVRMDGNHKPAYIFVEQKYQTDPSVNKEALKKAKEDLRNKAYTNLEMLDSATNEAVNTIHFLTDAIVGKEKIEVVTDEK